MTRLSVLVLVLCLTMRGGGEGSTRTPVVLDTDIGTDIDDTWALATLLRLDCLDVKLVLTDSHDTQGRTKIVAKFLESVGRTDIPVGVGVREDTQQGPQFAWAAHYDLSSYPGTIYDDGVAALAALLEHTAETVTIVCIGPTPNIRRLIQKNPHLARKARIVAMSGSIYRGWGNSSTPAQEYNVADNVPAAQVTYQTTWAQPLVTTPLDTCGVVSLAGDSYRDLLKRTNREWLMVLDAWLFFVNNGGNVHHFDPARESSILFDTVAVYLAALVSPTCTVPSFTKIAPIRVTVTEDGFTRPDPHGTLIFAALDWMDLQAYKLWLVQTLG